MKIVRRAADLPDYPTARVGLVPTMGAFHEGHLSLIRTARIECDKVVVSLFVNPLQFGQNEDLAKYPREEKLDAAMAKEAGADILFAPSISEMYPRESSQIHVPDVASRWEGAIRPGHFDGVATVVAKLFHMVVPQVVYFGLKDLQQCQVVRRMAEDLNFRIVLRLLPTVREADGLAFSSRNAYLEPGQRELAPKIHQHLESARQRLSEGIPAKTVTCGAIEDLESEGFSVDYFALVDLPDMVEIDEVSVDSALIVAARLGKTRLIDNLLLE